MRKQKLRGSAGSLGNFCPLTATRLPWSGYTQVTKVFGPSPLGRPTKGKIPPIAFHRPRKRVDVAGRRIDEHVVTGVNNPP